ncbi:phosphatidylglycerophosphatase A [Vulgatibacter incomptus]|uniref:Phosphatidylglycerophosphatase A n=1 Tax=Vulgatibacter incomptus TaxID=1391653 RepID=A0A0K1PE74_9BACT|nr:phosphatidylglycerophosphatase A [Vulgatibacter incomptus]AKU91797.1 Phosphatidylglycerophosphatase A [Vulgatibacter incomptus]
MARGEGLPKHTLWDRFAIVWSSGLGSGYFPVASGTFGTLAALPFAWMLSRIEPWWGWAACVALFTAVSVVTAHRAGQLHGVVDSKRIVSDEFAGLFITVGLLPFTWQVAVAGFFVFRVFDIVKPWPASYFDRKVHNGFGVTFDDVVAGVYARIVLEVLWRLGWLGAA